MSSFLYFQGQTINVCAFLLIHESLNEDKELNLTTNHRSPRAKRFANYTLKTGMEGVFVDVPWILIYPLSFADCYLGKVLIIYSR
jgi:hypothetical protein